MDWSKQIGRLLKKKKYSASSCKIYSIFVDFIYFWFWIGSLCSICLFSWDISHHEYIPVYALEKIYSSLLLFLGHQRDATGIGILMKQGNFSLMHCLRGHLTLLHIFPLNLPMSISFLFFLSFSCFSFFSEYREEIGLTNVDPQIYCSIGSL